MSHHEDLCSVCNGKGYTGIVENEYVDCEACSGFGTLDSFSEFNEKAELRKAKTADYSHDMQKNSSKERNKSKQREKAKSRWET